jgi:hypothetical protein
MALGPCHIRTVGLVPMPNTKQVTSSNNISALLSGGARFESQTGHRLSWGFCDFPQSL